MNNEFLALQKRGKTLEDLFFLRQDKILTEQHERMERMKETRRSLARVSGISNPDILQKLVELHIRPEVVATLALVPLVEIAWADGTVEEAEKAAVLAAAKQSFVSARSADYTILKQWLTHRPSPKLLDAWKQYISGLREVLSAGQMKQLKEDLLGHARQVAQAAGGFLGLTRKISKAEKKILDEMTAAFK